MENPANTSRPPTREELMKRVSQLVPGYLASRTRDAQTVAQALIEGDFTTIRKLGHKIKGSGTGYGFPQLSAIGGALEDAAEAESADGVGKGLEQLKRFLETVRAQFPSAQN